ncbi:MAG: CHAT domain-containing protein, partial [Flavobacteriaceae bacterium]|nr:CHAT domain-containing protein [Flavobacteriaceae bacterium]
YYGSAIDVISNAIGTQNTIYGQLCLGLLDVIYIIPTENIQDYQNLIDTSLSIFKGIEEGNNLHYYNALFFNGIKNLELEKYDQSLELFLKIEAEINKDIEKNSNIYNKVINHIASNYLLIEDYENAYKYLKVRNDNIINSVVEVFSFRSEKDKRTYLKTIESWFSDLTSISLDENFNNPEITSMSLNNQLLRKGLLLNSSKDIVTQLSTLNKPEVSAKIEEYKSLKDLIIYMELLPEIQDLEELDRIKADLNRFETELVELYNSYFKTDSNFKKDWKNIRASLNHDEVAIEFVSYLSSTNSEYIAYIIKHDSEYPKVVRLFKEQELKSVLSQKSINQLYASRGSSAKSISVSKDMYDVIWKPLEGHLNGMKTIYFSPVGLLNLIPFAALNAEGEDLLSVKHNLIQLSSTYLLTKTFSEPISNNTMFVGGIDYEFLPTNEVKSNTKQELNFLKTAKGTRSLGTTWDYLPGTLSEIEALQNLFQKNHKAYSSLTKKEATEESIKALSSNSPNVLHIATHGFFFENLPQEEKNEMDWSPELVYKVSEDPLMRSGLILAGANYAWKNGSNPYKDENGVLTALEISNLDLSNTDMVVLSACKTGLGDIDGSEGVYGLQRAFKMAGVDIIVMSLWEVPDKETVEFMNSFYTNWLGGLKVREAFNSTQRTMSNIYKDSPEKWAAFVLVE